MSQQPKIFYPQTPVDFNPSLIANLDSSLESDYTRQQYTEQFIEKEVNKRLKALESNRLTSLDKKLTDLLLPASKDDTETVKATNERLNQVTESLKKLNTSSSQKTAELLDAEAKVTSCLKESKGKVLNCWQEVESFKKLAGGL